MDKKVSLQDIVALLATREKMTKKKAEALVRGFFDVIAEGLARDQYVRIKGFGTFKIITVSERSSINIKTGERFQIGSHAKVTFTPDAALKDLVNRPFAQFHTVILNEGVDETLLAAVETAPAAVPAEEAATPAEEAAVPNEEPAAPVVEAAAPTEEREAAKPETQGDAPQEAETKTDAPGAAEEAPANSAESSANSEEAPTYPSKAPANSEASPAYPSEAPTNSTEAPTSPAEKSKRKRRLGAWIGVAALVAVVVLGLVFLPGHSGQTAAEQPQVGAAQPAETPQAQTQKPAAPQATPQPAPGKFTILLMQGVPQEAAANHAAQMKAAGFPDAEVTTYNGYVAIIYGHFPTREAATQRWRELKTNSYFRQSLPAELK